MGRNLFQLLKATEQVLMWLYCSNRICMDRQSILGEVEVDLVASERLDASSEQRLAAKTGINGFSVP